MEAQTGKGIFQYVMRLTWPIFIELLLQMLIGNIDQMMISSYQQEAVGAIANANQVLNILLLTFSMISTATTILVSQYKGAGQEKEVRRIYSLSVALNFVLGLALSAVLMLFADPLFTLLNVPAEFLVPAREYLQIVGSFSVIQALFLTFSAIFRSNKLMRTAMIVSIGMNVVNVIGNALLIYGLGPLPEMGIRGVALSTNISRLLGLVVLIVLFYRQLHGRIRLKDLRPFPFSLARQILSIGIPAGGESFSYNLTQLFILSFVNTFGAEATLARAYCATISSFALLYCLSVSQSSQVVIGYQVGAGDYNAANRTARVSALSSLVLTTGAAVLILLFCEPLLSLFSATPSVVTLCRTVLAIEVLRQFGRSFNMLYLRALQGAGDIHFPIIIGILDTWGVVVGIGYLLGCVFGFGLPGVWIAMALDENIRGVIFALRWRSGIWKNKRLIQNP